MGIAFKQVVSKTKYFGKAPFHKELLGENWPMCVKVCPTILLSGQSTSNAAEDPYKAPNLEQVKADTAGYVIGCSGVEILVGTQRDPDICALRCPNPRLAIEVLNATTRGNPRESND